MKYKKLVYISGKYSGLPLEIEDNINLASKYAKKYIKAGYSVHCPHMNTAHFDGLVQYKDFILMDLEILNRCDIIVMIPGWKKSRGARIEFLHAWLTGKEIIEEEKEYTILDKIYDKIYEFRETNYRKQPSVIYIHISTYHDILLKEIDNQLRYSVFGSSFMFSSGLKGLRLFDISLNIVTPYGSEFPIKKDEYDYLRNGGIIIR